MNSYSSLCRACVKKLDTNIVRSFNSGFDFISPLNNHHRLPIAVIIKAYGLELVYGIQPVRVYMVNVEPALILVDYNKGRAGNGSGGLRVPAPSAIPLISWVLPLPSWPQRAIISPPFSCEPNLRPSSMVWPAELEIISKSIILSPHAGRDNNQ